MLLRRMIQHVKTQNWLAVALDFVIVVLGVTFALIAEQWISNSQKRADLAEVETNLEADLINNYFYAKERLSLRDCRLLEMQEIGDQLLELESDWTPVIRKDADREAELIYGAVLRSPNRSWGSRVWDAEIGRGTFYSWSADRRSLVDAIFRLTGDLDDLQDDIRVAQARLKTLSVVTELSRSERLRYFDILVEVEQYSYWMEVLSQQVVDRVEMYEFDFDDEYITQMQTILDQTNAQGRDVYGECRVDIDFPILGETPAEAE